jgi:hypothetical protein
LVSSSYEQIPGKKSDGGHCAKNIPNNLSAQILMITNFSHENEDRMKSL